ncbi:centrosomal protein of 55 kDa isoform X2 [Cynoglossus semilaevis]|uniref:centrosomal protein of 55 kDa isoform X2 n=1 Tax=Cynoglossus semilaevis TaxID=244447 RepID=UPI0007DC9E31|nr:centrosomal protein of 55 kDa isoform X2 [Cynoglossus semilaevis]
MTSKGNKETIVSRLGFKSSSSPKVEAELERIRKENAHLRKKIDELAKRHIKPPDTDNSKLLERILALETLRERNNQQLLAKDQELEKMRQQLSAKGGEVVASLQSQLEQRRKEAELKDALYQSLTQEMENLKNSIVTVSARCETQVNGQVPPPDLAMVQDQLRDALEKNQQWLVYNEQREAYVRSIVVHTRELEQQVAQTKENKAEATAGKCAELNSQYEQRLSDMQKDLESHKNQVIRAQQEVSKQKEQTLKAQSELQSQKAKVNKTQEELLSLQRRHEDKCSELSSFLRKYTEAKKELEEAKIQLQAERLGTRHAVCEERMMSSEKADRMRMELDSVEARLEEEKKRSSDLLLQVNLLQKSLLSQHEEHGRITALEQQIQLSAKEFESEKIDRMQHQLHKVLKELRKARDQIEKLESAKQTNARFSEPSNYNGFELERLNLNNPTSPPKSTNLLDESFLECPKCHTSYPTSRHRELLAHLDFCMA